VEHSDAGATRGMLRRVAPYLAVVLVVVIANLISLTLTDPDPLLQRSGLPVTAGRLSGLPGFSTIDPNDGFTTQSLGIAAAHQLLHGQLPLWNSLEGLGEPLLAGMQSAALFPFVFLMLLPGGVLIFHLVLEVLAGIGALLLLRRLGLSPLTATAGAALFALNGVFAWLGNAVVNPIAFLPWVLFGIELARESDAWRRARGWWLVAAAIALSLLAGFPEVAYLNGVLAAVWALARLPGTRRKLVYLVSLAAGVAVGVAIAAPALIAFADYLPQAWVGGHGGGFSVLHVNHVGAAALVLPYLFGPIFGLSGLDTTNRLTEFWSSTGGYLTMGTAALAIVGLVIGRRRLLVLRLALAGWALLCLARIYGIPGLHGVLDLLPGGADIAQYRYLGAALAMATTVLAALGVDALLGGAVSRAARRVLAAVLAVGTAAAFVLCARVSLTLLHGAPSLHFYVGMSLLLAGGVVAVIVLALLFRGFPRALVVPVVIAEAVALFLVPQLNAPTRPASVDTAAVSFLQQNLHDQRYFGLGILKPNYGSYFGVASLDENNLPVPLAWQRYISTRLDPAALPDRFDGSWWPGGSAPKPEAEVYQHLAAYEAAGMKYLVASAGQVDAAESAKYGLTRAYGDASVEIWQTPEAAAYFSAPGCSVSSDDRSEALVDCPGPAQLTRLELWFPGWQVTVDGHEATVADAAPFQTVQLPAGHHVVRFRFWPADTTPSLVLAGAALLLLAAGVTAQALGRRRDTTTHAEPDPAPVEAASPADPEPLLESSTAHV
jgi:hypothetical protein